MKGRYYLEMATSVSSLERTRLSILHAAADLLARKPDAVMAEVAEIAGVGRATVYRHFPTRESLLRGVADRATADFAGELETARLDELPVERALVHLTAMLIRAGAKYAAMENLVGTYRDPDVNEQIIRQPIRDLLARGIREGVLRADLGASALFEMYSALIVRIFALTADRTLTPERASDTVLAIFLEGTRIASTPKKLSAAPPRARTTGTSKRARR